MNIDHLARQTHRRGFLAAALAALAVPVTGRAQVWRCAPPGGACSLLISCCGDETCYVQATNPNSGVCGGVLEADEDAGPAFISPTTGGSSPAPGRSRPLGGPSDPPGSINCDSFRCLEEAQAYYDADPSDPEGLDGPPGRTSAGIPGRVCEDQLPLCSEVA